MHGHNVYHVNNRTKRLFRQHIHYAKILVDGALRRVKLCVKCLRMAKREMKENSPLRPAFAKASAGGQGSAGQVAPKVVVNPAQATATA